MQTKLITVTAGLMVALAGLGGSAAYAGGSCPEARSACQPGYSPASQQPRVRTAVPKVTPKPAGSQGQLWQAGTHTMS